MNNFDRFTVNLTEHYFTLVELFGLCLGENLESPVRERERERERELSLIHI